MSFEIICSKCNQSLEADKEMIGQEFNCPNCNSKLIVNPPQDKIPSKSKNKHIVLLLTTNVCIALIVFTLSYLSFSNPQNLKVEIEKKENELKIRGEENVKLQESLNAKKASLEENINRSNKQKEYLTHALQAKKEMRDIVLSLSAVTATINLDQTEQAIKVLANYYPKDDEIVAIKNDIAKLRMEQKRKKDAKYAKLKTIREVETDLISFVGKEIVFNGTITLSTYFNFGYTNAKDSHYSFRVLDGTGDFNLYAPKKSDIGKNLRSQLLKHVSLRGSFTAKIPKHRFESGFNGADLIEYAPPLD